MWPSLDLSIMLKPVGVCEEECRGESILVHIVLDYNAKSAKYVCALKLLHVDY